MRIKTASLAVSLVVTVALSGCADGPGPKQTVGTLGGAVLGGWGGSQFGKGDGKLWATGAGAVLGALVGSEVGKSLDRADRTYMARSTQSALEYEPSGSRTRWSNPDSGHYGTVTPTQTYRTRTGRYCREFQQTVTVGGRYERAYGTACRQPDGSWQVVQ